MEENSENNQSGAFGAWVRFVLVLVVLGLVLYYFNYKSEHPNNSDCWEVRIIKTPDGFEIKKYDYDELLQDIENDYNLIEESCRRSYNSDYD